jgi:hypothetical protein
MGAYREAEKVEEDVRHMQEVNPDADEEASRELVVAYYAAIKRIRRRRRESVVEDLAEPMIRELFIPGPDYICCYSSQGLRLFAQRMSEHRRSSTITSRNTVITCSGGITPTEPASGSNQTLASQRFS